MYDKSLEPISAMMDGEIEEFELRRVIERTSNDQELQNKWLRYHLAQDVMKGREVQVTQKIDLVARVSATLESEPSYSSATAAQEPKPVSSNDRQSDTQWWKPLASMAMAASVTAVVLLGAQQYGADPIAQPSSELAGVGLNSSFPKSRFGNELSTVSAKTVQPAEVRNAYGMEQYIQKHQDLTYGQAANWQVNWLPEGYQELKHRVTAKSEVLLYKNGESTVSVNIEPLGTQVASQGVSGTDDLLAYGVRSGDSFITIVGQVSSKQAAKIAASIGVAKAQ
ncbi:MAG: MucB/RseB C-terminal domain-containing protein [Oceanospirillaceae bacterium]